MTTPFPFVAAQVLTAAELNAITNLPSSTKTANYVLVAGDAGKRIVMNAAGSTTITANTSLFSAGDVVELSNIGAGVCTVTAGTATVSSAGPLAIPQYGGGRLVFTSASAAIYFPSAVTVAAPAASGLTLITSTPFSGSATITVNSAFSATYNNYKIFINNLLCASSTPTFHFKFGAATSNYAYSAALSNATTFNDFTAGSASDSKIILGYIGSVNTTQMAIEVLAPFLSQKTFMYSNQTNYQAADFGAAYGSQNDNTSFTAFNFTTSGGTNLSGTLEVYGYAI
jgi:hypothetical protein